MGERRTRNGLCGLSLLLLGLTGCWTTEPSLRPPPRPEEYVLPPSDDPRFSNPVAYPKGTLFKDNLRKDSDGKDQMPAMRSGASRMGGPGGGY